MDIQYFLETVSCLCTSPHEEPPKHTNTETTCNDQVALKTISGPKDAAFALLLEKNLGLVETTTTKGQNLRLLELTVFFWLFQHRPQIAPTNGIQQWHQWHPTMAPHTSNSIPPWHGTQKWHPTIGTTPSAKLATTTPTIGSKNPHNSCYLGKNRSARSEQHVLWIIIGCVLYAMQLKCLSVNQFSWETVWLWKDLWARSSCPHPSLAGFETLKRSGTDSMKEGCLGFRHFPLSLSIYIMYTYMLYISYILYIYIALLIHIYIVSLCQPKSWQRTGNIITFFELISKDLSFTPQDLLLILQDCGGMKSDLNWGFGWWVGWGGVGRGQVSTYRAKNNNRPPTTYVNTRLVDDLWCSLPAACKTKLNAVASMLPRCAVHMLRTISLHFFRMNLNACRFWDGPIVFQRLARFTTSKPPTSILWYATFDIPTFWCDMRFEELWVTWPHIAFSHKSDPRFVRNWESNNPISPLQCSFVKIWLSSWLGHEWKFAMAVTTPRNPSWGVFSLEKY